MYTVEYTKDIKKDLSKIPKDEVKKILNKISELSKNPRTSSTKVLQGDLKGLHRLRSGSYRIIYQICDKKLVILVVRIAHRGVVYN